MFGLFKKLFQSQSPMEKLQARYKALLAEAHALSTVNRAASEAKLAEADAVLKQMEELNRTA